MLVRVVFETLLALQRALDVGGWHLGFLGQSVCVSEHGYILPVEEIKQPIIDIATSGPQLVDAVAQKISFRSSQFVTFRS